MLIKPQVLVLDQATSSLDTETEAAIIDSIRGLKGEYILVVIAHRLSTVRYADNIGLLRIIIAVGARQPILFNVLKTVKKALANERSKQ